METFTPDPAEYATKLDMFVSEVQNMVNANFAEMHPSLTPDVITYTSGRKYDRIVTEGRNHDGSPTNRGVYCFIQKIPTSSGKVGDILKADSWERPAKHARGNIFAEDMMRGVTSYGAVYLR